MMRNVYWDNMSTDVAQSIVQVLQELERAEGLHPDWPEDAVYQAAIIAEEAGEIVQAALDATGEAGRRKKRMATRNEEVEVTQCAAMCLRWLRHVVGPRQFEWLGTMTGLSPTTRRVLLEHGCAVASLAAVVGFVRAALESNAPRLWRGCGEKMIAELRAFLADVDGGGEPGKEGVDHG